MEKIRLWCSKCEDWKDEDDFPFKDKKKGKRFCWCRECNRAYQRNHYRSNKETYRENRRRGREQRRNRNLELVLAHLETHPCADCGESDVVVLEFNHVRGTKLGDISTLLSEVTEAVLVAEIGKCEVRCANCHRRKTARERGWSKSALHGAMF